MFNRLLKLAAATLLFYGHLDLDSINGEEFNFGEVIGFLGDAYSDMTDGERKHLHLGIHKGEDVNLFGYVQDNAELDEWINPWEIVGLKIFGG